MKYSLGKQIGDIGGFGNVYDCTSEQGDHYAIKILKDMTPSAIERFKKEIRLTNRLSHPNVIKIIDSRATDDQLLYIMPRYSSSLKAVIPALYGNYSRQYSVISEILNGVIYLHSEGVLHRDLKPQNILYNSDSDIVINDFGLGRQIDSESDCRERMTQVGDQFGTARYTAPEQLRDASSADEKSDIFSIGKIIEDIVTNYQTSVVPTPEFEYIIDRCTQQNPSKRFNSAIELKSAVDSVYLQLLGIAENNLVNDYLTQIKMGNINANDLHDLAQRLLSDDSGDKIEELFNNLPNEWCQYLEEHDPTLYENLISKLSEYFVSQGWPFGYTDSIGDNCKRIYNLSRSPIVRAALLYSIIEVGIRHNRFHVMGIASDLIKEVVNSPAEGIELSRLLGSSSLSLDSLNISMNDLPSCLRTHFR